MGLRKEMVRRDAGQKALQRAPKDTLLLSGVALGWMWGREEDETLERALGGADERKKAPQWVG